MKKIGKLIKTTVECGGAYVRPPNNLSSNSNMSGSLSTKDKYFPCGENCFLTIESPDKAYVTFDLGGTKKLSYMYIWNFAMQPFYQNAGMRKVKIETSLDGINYQELKGKVYPYILAKAREDCLASNLDDGKNSPIDFDGLQAAYVKITPIGGAGEGNHGIYVEDISAYGLGKVRIYEAAEEVGKNEFRAVPAHEWSAEFSNMDGWGGADGIFCVPLDGKETRGDTKKTLVLFSDTFVGKCNPETKVRQSMNMLNNTFGYLTNNGYDKRNIKFVVGKDKRGQEVSLITPQEGSEYYYWLQDAVTLGDFVYAFTDNVISFPEGPPGFKFDVIGVDIIKIPIVKGKAALDKYTIIKTNLHTKKGFFGCCVYPNTVSSGMPNPDGYVYVYGLGKKEVGQTLLLSRVKEEDFEDSSKYVFWDGKNWSNNIDDAIPISQDGGSECSITPVTYGKYKDKYMYTHMQNGIDRVVAVSFADSLTGPFDKDIPIYSADDDYDLMSGGDCKGVYLYNAKAHYHISPKDELLISYNINTSCYQSNMNNCDIYRPRFIRLKGV
ncbi:MAG: DUF4185 domain-containing protein [Firmicutes bacterium]|nr:DUF4185 domain-containing protein [Bacillota bacterium]